MSKPVHIIGSDKRDYILKTQNVYDQVKKDWVYWDCMFINELLVYKIAKYLDIPIPDCAIVYVEKIFLDHAPTLVFGHRYSPGHHFASNIIPGVENNLKKGYIELMRLGKPYIKTSWRHFFNGISNKNDAAGIVVLDLLTANFDRFGNDGNLLVASNDGTRKIYVIDHGHCFFGPIWSNMIKRETMHRVGNNQQYLELFINCLMANTGSYIPMDGLGIIYQALEQHIDVSDPLNHDFMDIVLRVEAINVQLIDDWFSDIPDEWYVDKNTQISTYKNFILKQKDLIRILINLMAKNGAFNSSFLGGELQWKEKRTGTL